MTTEQNESPASETNVFAQDPHGFRVHFKLRTTSPGAIVRNLDTLIEGLMAKGYTPDESHQSPTGGQQAAATDVPRCPDCGGEVYDNRGNRPSPKSPHFKCKNKSCAAVGWQAEGGQVSWQKGRGQGNNNGQRY